MSSFPIKIFKVAERSMEPTIKSGDYVVVFSFLRDFRKGDLVVLRHPKKDMMLVKRIDEVKGGSILVIGDNKGESEDSRKFGKVDESKIVGKVVLKI